MKINKNDLDKYCTDFKAGDMVYIDAPATAIVQEVTTFGLKLTNIQLCASRGLYDFNEAIKENGNE